MKEKKENVLEKEEEKTKEANVDEESLKLKDIDKELSKEEVIEISDNEIEEMITEKAKAYRGKVKIRGFRPGKVPLDYIKRYFYKELLNETIDEIVNQKIKEIVSREKNIATYPNVSRDYEKGKGLKLKIQYETLSDFDLGDYKEIEVEDVSIDVSEEEIDREIERLRAQVAEVVPIEKGKAIEDEDVIVDFEFQIKNPNTGKWMKKELLKSRKVKEQVFMGVKDKLIGMKVGEEKVFKGKIPEELDAKNFAGKETEARIKVLSAKKIILPEINDDFAKSLGEYSSLKELKEKIKEAIENKKREERKYIIGERVLSEIEKKVEFGVPVSFIFQEMNTLFKQGAKYDPATSLKVSRENIKKIFIVEKIAKENDIKVEEKDIDEYIETQAKVYNITPQMFKSYLTEDHIAEIKHQILRNKTILFLSEIAKIKGEKQKKTSASTKEEQKGKTKKTQSKEEKKKTKVKTTAKGKTKAATQKKKTSSKKAQVKKTVKKTETKNKEE